MDPADRYLRDLALVGRISAGSEPDWQDFVTRYSPLIRSVLCKYFHDREQAYDLWADVLQRLRGGLLARYQGRSALSTWLVVVVRRAAADELRRTRGRRRTPTRADSLSDRQRWVYVQMFERGRGAEDLRLQMLTEGRLRDGESLAEIVATIEDVLGDKTLGRLAWDLQADSVGAVSGRMLAYLEDAAAESAERQLDLSPERLLLHEQTRETLARITLLLDDLPPDERRVLELRYKTELPAREVAAQMALRPRDVYTVTLRALRTLRRLLGIMLVVGLCLGTNFFW